MNQVLNLSKGHRDDIWIRLSTHQCTSIHTSIQYMFVLSLPCIHDFVLIFQDFGAGYVDPTTHQLGVNPPLLGIINASYSLGAILAVPIAPYFNQLVGRRWGIMSGSISMVIGSLLQGFAQHGSPSSQFVDEMCTDICSCHVCYCPYAFRLRHSLRHHFGISDDWRTGVSKRTSYHDLTLQRLLFLRCYYCGSNILTDSRNYW
jgi:hypothetical protein